MFESKEDLRLECQARNLILSAYFRGFKGCQYFPAKTKLITGAHYLNALTDYGKISQEFWPNLSTVRILSYFLGTLRQLIKLVWTHKKNEPWLNQHSPETPPKRFDYK